MYLKEFSKENTYQSISIETLKEICQVANYYPSADNIQCFKIVYENERVLVKYIHHYGEHSLNFNEVPNLITLGHLLYYIEQSALNFGYEAFVRLIVDEAHWDKDMFVASIHFEKSDKPFDFNIEVLKSRHVDRRVLPGKINELEIQRIKSLENDNNQLHIVRQRKGSFISFMASMDSIIYDWHDSARDLFKWINTPFNKSNRGLELDNLGITKAESLILIFLKKFPSLIPLAFNIFSASFFRFSMRRVHSKSDSHIIFTYRPNESFEKKVKRSKQICRSWLTMTSLGISLQPHTLSTIFRAPTNKKEQDHISSNANFKFDEMKQKSFFINKYLSLAEGEEPLWVLRVGRPLKPLSKGQRTKRISCREFFDCGD